MKTCDFDCVNCKELKHKELMKKADKVIKKLSKAVNKYKSEEEIEQIVTEYGDRVDPQGMADGYDECISKLLSLFTKKQMELKDEWHKKGYEDGLKEQKEELAGELNEAKQKLHTHSDEKNSCANHLRKRYNQGLDKAIQIIKGGKKQSL